MSSAYGWFCRNVLMPVGDVTSGQRVMRYLRWYARSQYWPREVIRSEQDGMLRRTLRTAVEEVPFYRDLYRSSGVDAREVRGVADLPMLPMVTKAMLREAGAEACVRRTPHRTQVYSTSGSTGNPFSLHVDADTMSRARALMLLRTMYAGWRPGEAVLQTGTAPERGLVKGMKDRLLRVKYVSAFNLTDAVMDVCLREMDRRGIDYLTGYAQSLFLIARRAKQIGFTRRLKSAVSWGALLLPHYREEVREAFGCEVYDSYGVGEGMQVAAQCGQASGAFHQFALHVAVEICNGGTPVPAGERGEILLTRLDAGATPLIRYAIGDLAVASGKTTCPCGRTLPLIESVDGRTSDIIRTPSGRVLIIHFFSRLFSSLRTVDQYQIVQKSADEIVVRIVPLQGFDNTEWQRLRRLILETGDPALKISLQLVADIPIGANGKRRYIVSELS